MKKVVAGSYEKLMHAGELCQRMQTYEGDGL